MRFCLLASLLLLACSNERQPPIDPPCVGAFGGGCCEGPGCCLPGMICEDFPPPPDPARSLPELVEAEVPPLPIAGGTLLIASSGTTALAGDADRDAIFVADLAGTPALVAAIELRSGDEPGRIVEQAPGQFLAVLRGAGEIARIGSDPWSVIERVPVCASPRGLFAGANEVLVACASGDLVTLDESLKETRRVRLPRDLRDVVAVGDRVYVSRFKTAQVLVLDSTGAIVARHELDDPDHPEFSAGAAYRMIPAGGDGVLVLHQLARTEGAAVSIEVQGGYGGTDCNPSIVQAAVTELGPRVGRETTALGNFVVPVDVAVRDWSPTAAGTFAIAAAGVRTDDFGGFGGLTASRPFIAPRAAQAPLLPQSALTPGAALNHCFTDGQRFEDGRRVTSVAFDGGGRLVMLTRAPTEIVVVGDFEREVVALPGRDVFDTGHELFLGDAGGGIACASCHLEGGEDGKVWTFEGIGPRRTQDIRGGILGTEPFHWDGDMSSFQHLASEVFDERMLGPSLPGPHADAFVRWIDALPMPPADLPIDAEQVARGREVFERTDAGCTTCHAGPRFSSPLSFDVGTGSAVQVPSLIGVVHRAPYMHDGCAATLGDRFTDPSCGGALHGNTSHLSATEIDDLVAFLETL
jgi:hypothetical protein